MTDYSKRLNDMQGAYDEADARTSGVSVPDGDYELQIERFDFWEKEGGGPLKLITELSVVGGDHAGLSAPSLWHELEDPERIAWTKGYLETLGLQGVALAELPKALEPLCGKARVSGRVVTTESNGKKYRNVYVNELLGMGEDWSAPASTDDASTEPEEDIPF
jgi:hypothetical protein